MARLKSATAEAHRRTEAIMPTKAMLSGSLDKVGYAALLSDLFRIYHSLEQHLENTIPPYPALSHFFQKKAPWLAEDLQHLGRELPPPLPKKHPHHGMPQLAGMMYVLEGSMLGGQVILKGLRKSPHLARMPHHFYSGNGAKTRKRWGEFCRICEATIAEEEMPLATDGANYTFAFFQQQLL